MLDLKKKYWLFLIVVAAPLMAMKTSDRDDYRELLHPASIENPIKIQQFCHPANEITIKSGQRFRLDMLKNARCSDGRSYVIYVKPKMSLKRNKILGPFLRVKYNLSLGKEIMAKFSTDIAIGDNNLMSVRFMPPTSEEVLASIGEGRTISPGVTFRNPNGSVSLEGLHIAYLAENNSEWFSIHEPITRSENSQTRTSRSFMGNFFSQAHLIVDHDNNAVKLRIIHELPLRKAPKRTQS